MLAPRGECVASRYLSDGGLFTGDEVPEAMPRQQIIKSEASLDLQVSGEMNGSPLRRWCASGERVNQEMRVYG